MVVMHIDIISGVDQYLFTYSIFSIGSTVFILSTHISSHGHVWEAKTHPGGGAETHSSKSIRKGQLVWIVSCYSR